MGGIALVTGGSGGIGSAICKRLATDGFTVIVGYNASAAKAGDVVTSLQVGGVGAPPHEVLQVPVTDSVALGDAAAHVNATHGHLDLLVNCAGVTKPVPHDDLDGLDDETIDQIFATNVRGPLATIRAMRPALEAAPDGAVVINISSVAAVTGQGSNVAYCASKAALDSITRSLARALGPSIRMVSVSPGWVLGEYADRMDQTMLATQRSETPLDRLATPDDVAAAVSAAALHLPFTTGATISVDGGRPLGAA